ncbi:MAG TPA: helix-turn-helix domain-containing protein, partial [Usitatibacter sp.]|nr:helix-turn-helix domain-containing protein [Usitatibacter sp.]
RMSGLASFLVVPDNGAAATILAMDLSASSNFGPDASRVVAIVTFDGARALDIAGAMEVFSAANCELRSLGRDPDRGAYAIQVVSPDEEASSTSCGLRVLPTQRLDLAASMAIDTVIVPGGTGQGPDHVPRLSGLIARIAERAGRVVVPDGCNGILDLSLALIRDDHGDEIAARVRARTSQGAPPLPELGPGVDPRIAPLAAWIIQDPRREFSAELLASQAAMSVRTLSRLFVREMGITPSKFVEKVRLGVARNLLETSRLRLAAIAAQSGFGSEERMRRAFRRAYGTSPRAHVGERLKAAAAHVKET